MPSIAFDTYKAVKALKRAGFEKVQAEVVVATVAKLWAKMLQRKQIWLKSAPR